MKKLKTILGIVVIALFANVNLVTAQNMSSWVEMTVEEGETICFSLSAISENTPIRIISGSTDTTIIAGTNLTLYRDIYADSTTMTMYGDIVRFDCSSNQYRILNIDASNSNLLNHLDCSDNKLTSLYLNGLTELKVLVCMHNLLTSIEINELTSLELLSCSNNSLTSLDVSENTSLETLYCGKNNMTSLDLTGLTSLKKVHCYINNLTSLNVNGLNALEELWCHTNNLTSLDLTGLTSLKDLYCGKNNLTSLNVNELTALNLLHCSNNNLTSLDVNEITTLTSLSCSDNNLTSLDISGLAALKSLNCSGNNLSSLDLSESAALKFLDCSHNNITSLNISNLIVLNELWCYNNSLTSINLSGATALGTLLLWDNDLSTHNIDLIYCELPMKGTNSYARICPVYSPSSSNYTTVIATNKQNALDKNWSVQYGVINVNIPATNGTYECETSISTNDIAETKIYPNPVSNILHINTDSQIKSIELYDVFGRLVLNKTNLTTTDIAVNVSHLNSGVYVLKLNTTKGSIDYRVVKR